MLIVHCNFIIMVGDKNKVCVCVCVCFGVPLGVGWGLLWKNAGVTFSDVTNMGYQGIPCEKGNLVSREIEFFV